MIWFLVLGLAALVLLPFLLALLRPAATRGRRDADLALYRAQLAELDREREAGRLDEAQHRAATVEVQRRLLAAPSDADSTASAAPRFLIACIALLPAAALGLYMLRGTPGMPSATHTERVAVAARDDALIEGLRARLAQLDPSEEPTRRGYVLLGNAERSRGRIDAAAAAWDLALATRFDPALAAEYAGMELERQRPDVALPLLERVMGGSVPEELGVRIRFLTGIAHEMAGRPAEARRAWQAIIDASPPDAPWRAMLERRMERLPP